jgi:branched-subunit amino acid ABC-type transport system permease component
MTEPMRPTPSPQAPAAPPRSASQINWQVGLAVLVAAAILPFFLKNFVVFQITMVMIYAIAIIGLNLLTGFNGQFSLGHAAFYAIGAYTAAILMDKFDVSYVWTLPIAGLVSFVFGYPVRPAGAAARRHLSGAGDVRAVGGGAAIAEAVAVRALDRRRAGHRADQAGRAVRAASQLRTAGCISSRWRWAR